MSEQAAPPTPDEAHDQVPERLSRAVEQVSTILTEGGMPRMAARVFAYALAEDSDRYTAAELAQGLQVSPAAVSGAVRYLVSTRLLFKERRPGSRAEVYRVHDEDVWSAITTARLPMLWMWEQAMHDAAALVGQESRGGRRLEETAEFFRFTREETAGMLERWKQHRRTLG
jgi:predicted transcriptional regulator